MRFSLAKTSFVVAILLALAPSFAAAQSTDTQTTTLLSLLTQVTALQQELSTIEATIDSILGISTSTPPTNSGITQTLSLGNILSGSSLSNPAQGLAGPAATLFGGLTDPS